MTDQDSILIVDDESGMRRLVNRTLSQKGYQVEEAANGQQMMQVLSEKTIHLVILDLKLPGEDGFSLARKIRTDSNVPIIMLTGESELVDKVVGLEIGADDYITKPFDGRELVARVRAVLRRNSQKTEGQKFESNEGVIFRGWRLEFGPRQLTSPEGEKIQLTTLEYQVFYELVSRHNRVLSRNQIANFVFNRDLSPEERSIDIVIAKLRKKLNDSPSSPKFILTARNQGYTFVANVEKFPD